MKFFSKTIAFVGVVSSFMLIGEQSANAQTAFLGEIRSFSTNFCPRNWAEADGQVLQISQNPMLYSLFGATYGGDGRTTFRLPNLQGHAAMGVGKGPSLSYRLLGRSTGVSELDNEVAHDHQFLASTGDTTTTDPAGANFPSPSNARIQAYGSDRPSMDTLLSPDAVSSAPPVSITQPILALKYCVALNGVFPPRF